MEGNCQCLPLEVLSLSGDYETKCTVCNEEIAFLCAKGLPELRCLSLQWAPMLGDPSMELLAGAGGAHRLTSLSLGGDVMFSQPQSVPVLILFSKSGSPS